MLPNILKALVLIGLSISAAAASSLAEMRPSDLEVGAPVARVIRAWGGPDEKIERETARKADWHYSFGQVTFQEGKVLKWERASDQPIRRRRPVLPPQAREEPAPSASPETQQVLREILSELPSAPDSPSSDGAPIMNPIAPMPLDRVPPDGMPEP